MKVIIRLTVLCIFLLNSCSHPGSGDSFSEENGSRIAPPEFRVMSLDYGWNFDPAQEPIELSSPPTELKNREGGVIATVPTAVAEKLILHKRGLLPEPDGRLLQLVEGSHPAVFDIVDKSLYPWGSDNKGNPLVPFKSIYGPEGYVQTGDVICIPYFMNKIIDGKKHNGYFNVCGTLPASAGEKVRIFAGDYGRMKSLDPAMLVPRVELTNQLRPVEYVTVRIMSDTGLNVYPQGSVSVRKGDYLIINYTPKTGFLPHVAYVNSRVQTLEGDRLILESVLEDTAVFLTSVPEQYPRPEAVYTIDQDWGTGFSASLLIKNNTDIVMISWQIKLYYKGDQKVTGWNGQFEQTNNSVIIQNHSWNGKLHPGDSLKVGLSGSYSGINDIPAIVAWGGF